MILGAITQEPTYALLARTPAFRRALDWIRALPPDPADGITELDGRALYANVHRYATKPRAACAWESHRHTADVQYVFEGGELIDWTPAQPAIAAPATYDAARDFATWPDTIEAHTAIRLTAGAYAIFLPGELHRPMIADGVHATLRKLVVKIDARLLHA